MVIERVECLSMVQKNILITTSEFWLLFIIVLCIESIKWYLSVTSPFVRRLNPPRFQGMLQAASGFST